MGQEISRTLFRRRDFERFSERLQQETALLKQWICEDALATAARPKGGFEVEAWILDGQGIPAPINEQLIAFVDNPNVVPELAAFNVEINGRPHVLRDTALSQMQRDLEAVWKQCDDAAHQADARLGMVGILPSLTPRDLSLANMSSLKRYRALNEQMLRGRRGTPLHVDIEGPGGRLVVDHETVMLEAATTSFQIHLKVNATLATQYFNAATIVAAPLVAAAANAPFLFGRHLWAETRIPLFEQAVSMGACADRATLGSGYVCGSIIECFEQNIERYPVLLPLVLEEPLEKMPHLRLHNGTVWRWNRPLIGFDDDGTPHLRIEHRALPAGPTIVDSIANAALFFGLVAALARDLMQPETQLPFEQARSNFYRAARDGLDAAVVWMDGTTHRAQKLIADQLIPRAKEGLLQLGLDAAEADHYLEILHRRTASGQTGAAWQREYVRRNGPDMRALTQDYLARQDAGLPVHEWSL